MTKRKPRMPVYDLPGEIWALVPGNDRYEVSSFGRVKSTEKSGRGERLRRLRIKRNGYVEVNLWDGGATGYKFYLVHRLVLSAFRGPPQPGMEGRHKDGIRDHNWLNNLEWGTPKENERDKERHGTRLLGERTNSVRLTEDQVRLIRDAYAKRSGQGWGCLRLAAEFGVHKDTIRRVANGTRWNHVRG